MKLNEINYICYRIKEIIENSYKNVTLTVKAEPVEENSNEWILAFKIENKNGIGMKSEFEVKGNDVGETVYTIGKSLMRGVDTFEH